MERRIDPVDDITTRDVVSFEDVGAPGRMVRVEGPMRERVVGGRDPRVTAGAWTGCCFPPSTSGSLVVVCIFLGLGIVGVAAGVSVAWEGAATEG